MKVERGLVPIDVARELVEEALVVALRGTGSEIQAEFREEMEAVQGIEIVDIREERFEALDSRWMERLRVADTFERVLASHPGIEDLVSKCLLKLARANEGEKAFLDDDGATVGRSDEKPALVVELTVDTLLADDKLERLLSATLARARRYRADSGSR